MPFRVAEAGVARLAGDRADVGAVGGQVGALGAGVRHIGVLRAVGGQAVPEAGRAQVGLLDEGAGDDADDLDALDDVARQVARRGGPGALAGGGVGVAADDAVVLQRGDVVPELVVDAVLAARVALVGEGVGVELPLPAEGAGDEGGDLGALDVGGRAGTGRSR